MALNATAVLMRAAGNWEGSPQGFGQAARVPRGSTKTALAGGECATGPGPHQGLASQRTAGAGQGASVSPQPGRVFLAVCLWGPDWKAGRPLCWGGGGPGCRQCPTSCSGLALAIPTAATLTCGLASRAGTKVTPSELWDPSGGGGNTPAPSRALAGRGQLGIGWISRL